MRNLRKEHNRSDNAVAGQVCEPDLVLNEEYIDKILPLVRQSKREIYLCAYAWRQYKHEPDNPVQQFLTELILARARGVTVKAILDNAGMALTLQKLGLEVKVTPPSRVQHSKVICIDDYALAVGSHNLTKKGCLDNLECSVVLYDFEPIEQFRTYFNRMWGVL
jgi:phosphatidylserine/phosphatidylglycerophosphate/cardiolipin synthase-like enzyme